jgi:AcrR family transcriptional regulator
VVHDAILQAAEEEFSAEGLHTARMERIAARAGVAVGTLYNHFKDKDALLKALLASRREELLARLDATLKSTMRSPFRERLEGFLRALLEHFEAHRTYFAVVVQAEHARVAQMPTVVGSPSPTLREVLQRIELLVKSGLQEKALRSDQPELLPALLLGMVRTVLLMELFYAPKQSPLHEQAGALADFYLRGAGRP